MRNINNNLIFFFFVPLFCLSCVINKNPLSYDSEGIHIRSGFVIFGQSPRTYKFNDVPEDISFIESFPMEEIRSVLSDDIMNSINIEYWIYTSVYDAELAMVERLELSNLYMYNMIDFDVNYAETNFNFGINFNQRIEIAFRAVG